jgi:hypothetical protein
MSFIEINPIRSDPWRNSLPYPIIQIDVRGVAKSDHHRAVLPELLVIYPSLSISRTRR